MLFYKFLLCTEEYEMIMFDLEDSIVNYGPIKMVEELHYMKILNSTSYEVMTALIHLDYLDQATILIDLISDSIRDEISYKTFKNFLKSKTSLDHLYYQLVVLSKITLIF